MADPIDVLRPYAALLRQSAARYGVPASLLAGLVWYESGGRPTVRSPAGAVGLGQVMPRERGFPGRPTAKELEDPARNLEWSARILSEGIKRWGTVEQGLGAYLGATDAQGRVSGRDPYTGVTGTQYVTRILQLAGDVGERVLRATAGSAEAAGEEPSPQGRTTAMSDTGRGLSFQPAPPGTEGPPVPVAPLEVREYLEQTVREVDQGIQQLRQRQREAPSKLAALNRQIVATKDKDVQAALRAEASAWGEDALEAQLKSLTTQRQTAVAQLAAFARDEAKEGAKAPQVFGGQETGYYYLGADGQPVPLVKPVGAAGRELAPEEAALKQAQAATEGAQQTYYGAQTARTAAETVKLLEDTRRATVTEAIAQEWRQRQQELVQQLTTSQDPAARREALEQLYQLSAAYVTPDALRKSLDDEADRRLKEADYRAAVEGVVYDPVTLQPLKDEQGEPRLTEAARKAKADEAYRQQTLEVSRRQAAVQEGQLEVNRSGEQRSIAELVGALGSQAQFTAVQRQTPHAAGSLSTPLGPPAVPGDQSEPVGLRILRQLGVNPDQLGLLRGGGTLASAGAAGAGAGPAVAGQGPPQPSSVEGAAGAAAPPPPAAPALGAGGPPPSAAAQLVLPPSGTFRAQQRVGGPVMDEGIGPEAPEAGSVPEAAAAPGGGSPEQAAVPLWQQLLDALDEDEARRRRAAA